MRARSLALTTELAIRATRGRITDRGAYLVVETPDDRDLLVLPAPPQVGEVAYWIRRFETELGERPTVTLWWDGVTGDPGAADELRTAGFTIEVAQVMVADEVVAPTVALPIRALAPDDVLATADLAWAIGDRHDESYRQFLHRRATWQQGLVARGAARFWGSHDGDALVASLGLVPVGTVARYQDVQVAPGYRRRGLAAALLAAAARGAGVERVVILAEPDSAAARIYHRVGFRTVERTVSACRYPTGGAAAPLSG